MNDVTQAVTDEVRRVIQDELRDARLVDVSITDEIDHDGDPFLRVEVVFDSENTPLDPQKVKGLGRHLREPMRRLNERRFLVFSFKTAAEQAGEAA